ncbi:MAG: NAD(P)H-dependent oxidoreductase [Saprospirales bacterium]|nr:MAG: NAD(P)H-dependent oxidoreductase [Saprospirales bacterium]
MNKKEQITIISGTNRPNSHTAIIASHIHQHLHSIGRASNLIDLENIDGQMLSNEMYSEAGQHPDIKKIQDDHFEHQTKFIFIAPEYNGSIPGVLKVFIDALSVRKYSETFFHKKACLIGVASGRAGNLRGLDHLGDVLSYLGVILFPAKLPVSRVTDYVDKGEITDPEVKATINKLIDDFLGF